MEDAWWRNSWKAAVEDEAVVLEDELSDEEADSVWVVPQWEVLAENKRGWRAGLESLGVIRRKEEGAVSPSRLRSHESRKV